MNKTREYYNSKKIKWLQDFCSGNPRIISAIEYACLQLVKHKPQAILDLGCGIGWSSYEFTRHLPNAKVTAVDFSDGLLNIGKALFPDKRIEFCQQDVTDERWAEDQPQKFDACVMLDVYEHIRGDEREAFNFALAKLLSDNSIIIITAPTYLHQQYLRENKPEGLQPVDEDITLHTLLDLAKAVSGEVIEYSSSGVWMANDYLHTTIQRNCSRRPRSNDETLEAKVRILSPASRLRRTYKLESLVPEETLKKLRSPLRPSRRAKRWLSQVWRK